MVTNFILCFWEKNGLKIIYAPEGICLFNIGTAALWLSRDILMKFYIRNLKFTVNSKQSKSGNIS